MAKILIACSGFKDVLPAKLLCNHLKECLLRIDSSLLITALPLSDGGEGFLKTFEEAIPTETFSKKSLQILGPASKTLTGEYGILKNSQQNIGIVELARLSGIEYLSLSERNPYFTTCHGTGQVISHLYEKGIRKIILGLGGSATTDGGLSLLYALNSFEFEFEGIQKPFFLTGSDLRFLKSVKVTQEEILQNLEITLACDVNNPMLGLNGSARVFGPQKGITPEMMPEYESLMLHVNEILTGIKGKNIGNWPFTGAAGGVSGGILASFEKVTVKKGVDIISELVDLEAKIQDSDFVITGEGCFDSQTSHGKVVSKIRELCNSSIIICGINKSESHENVYDLDSRFGNRSISAVHECLSEICVEIYNEKLKYK